MQHSDICIAGAGIIGLSLALELQHRNVHVTALEQGEPLQKASTAAAPLLETWAGLRPSTPGGLPLFGPIPGQPHRFLAAGHYRNGILLAPATARVMAQLLTGEHASLNFSAFSPARSLPPG